MEEQKNVATYAMRIDTALVIVRLVLGVIFIAHGSQKLFGAFSGPGLSTWIGMVGHVGYLVAIGEFFGGIGIIAGFLSRFSSAAIIMIMMGAIVWVHAKNGFFAGDNGFEYPLALIGLAVPILVLGPGRLALVRVLPLPKGFKNLGLVE